jgi:hypothetical protein
MVASPPFSFVQIPHRFALSGARPRVYFDGLAARAAAAEDAP